MRVLGALGLGESAQGVLAGVGHEDADVLFLAAKNDDADALCAEFAEGGGAEAEVTFDADAFDDVQRHGGGAYAVAVKGEGVAFYAHFQVFAVDVEGAHEGFLFAGAR